MAKKKIEKTEKKNAANIAVIITIIFLACMCISEAWLADTEYNYITIALITAILLILAIIIQKYSSNQTLAFTLPMMLLLFYTYLMTQSEWNNSNYFFICFSFSVISCLYRSINRTFHFIIVKNIMFAVLLLNDVPIGGAGTSLFTLSINWGICLCGNIVMLLYIKSATVTLSGALEYRDSFINLLATTENYIAMINERNEVVYSSKTLSTLSNTENSDLVHGRPFIDLFPGRSLKVYAGKLLKEKDSYAADWEFSLDGQKRYFKAASNSLPGGKGDVLINLYDMTHLAERDEIAVMKDSMRIGLFFMDRNYIIQDHYSRYLEEMLHDTKLFGRLFTDIISDSVSASEMEAIKDYFKMVLEHTYDLDMLEEINPLNELHYVNKNTGTRKVFQFAFATVERGRGETFILVTVYDITTRVELQQRLAEEEARRQEEMQAVFELIQVEPDVFNDFLKDLEHEFDNIDNILKNDTLATHDALVKIYQSVHAVKSNAVILGLNIFGGKMHNLESKIKKLREMGNVPFAEMLNLTMDLEKIFQEKEGFKEIIDKLHSHAASGGGGGEKKNINVMIESLSKTASRAAQDLEKQIKFVAAEIDPEAIEKGPRRVMKEILMQLIRNSAVHGIELPEDRKAKGKNEAGTVKLVIKMSDDHKNINIKLTDDGKGLDYAKIAERAISKKLIKPEDANNNDMLTKAIFAPGFSTAETEGVHGGRGIGLNLVRDRLKEVNGTIKMRSETNKGMVFQITLPAVPDADA